MDDFGWPLELVDAGLVTAAGRDTGQTLAGLALGMTQASMLEVDGKRFSGLPTAWLQSCPDPSQRCVRMAKEALGQVVDMDRTSQGMAPVPVLLVLPQKGAAASIEAAVWQKEWALGGDGIALHCVHVDTGLAPALAWIGQAVQQAGLAVLLSVDTLLDGRAWSGSEADILPGEAASALLWRKGYRQEEERLRQRGQRDPSPIKKAGSVQLRGYAQRPWEPAAPGNIVSGLGAAAQSALRQAGASKSLIGDGVLDHGGDEAAILEGVLVQAQLQVDPETVGDKSWRAEVLLASLGDCGVAGPGVGWAYLASQLYRGCMEMDALGSAADTVAKQPCKRGGIWLGIAGKEHRKENHKKHSAAYFECEVAR